MKTRIKLATFAVFFLKAIMFKLQGPPHNVYHRGSKFELDVDDTRWAPSVLVAVPSKSNLRGLRKALESASLGLNRLNLSALVIAIRTPSSAISLQTFREASSRADLVIDTDIPFNYSNACNLAVSQSDADVIVLLNDDVVFHDETWLKKLIEPLKNPLVAAVAPVLRYPNGRVQHAGIAFSESGLPYHPSRGESEPPLSLGSGEETCRKVSGVTFAAAAISRKWFLLVGGLDPKFPDSFNDVAFCHKAKSLGGNLLVRMDVEGEHLESATRGNSTDVRRILKFPLEIYRFLEYVNYEVPTEPYHVTNDHHI